MDYIFPDKIAKVLRKPSERTQLEASLVGITFILLGTIGLAIYFIFFTEMSAWFKVLLSLSEIGIISFQLSTLTTTYIQYHILKTTLGLYPEDKKLDLKIQKAKVIVKELNKIIEENEKP